MLTPVAMRAYVALGHAGNCNPVTLGAPLLGQVLPGNWIGRRIRRSRQHDRERHRQTDANVRSLAHEWFRVNARDVAPCGLRSLGIRRLASAIWSGHGPVIPEGGG